MNNTFRCINESCGATIGKDTKFVRGWYNDSKSTSDLGFNTCAPPTKSYNESGCCPMCGTNQKIKQ